MNLEENDPDTLQLRDEMDSEWVELWRRCKNKEKSITIELTSDFILTKKV